MGGVDHVARLQTDVVARVGDDRRQKRLVHAAAALEGDDRLVSRVLGASGACDGVQESRAAGLQREAGRRVHLAQNADLVGLAIADADDHLRFDGARPQFALDVGLDLGRRTPDRIDAARVRDRDLSGAVDLLRRDRDEVAGAGARAGRG